MPFNAQEKKERTLTETIVIIIVLALLMASFLHYFFKESESYNSVGFLGLANAFRVSVNTIHAQWFMENSPTFIYIKPYAETEETEAEYTRTKDKQVPIPINKNGWVDASEKRIAESGAARCTDIWNYVLERPLFFMKEPLSVIDIRKKNTQMEGVICQYRLSQGQYFEYDTTSGKVSQIKGY